MYKEKLLRLNASLKFFYCENNFLLFCILKSRSFFVLKFPSFYFFKRIGTDVSFLFTERDRYKIFLNSFKNLMSQSNGIFFSKISMKGLGFRVKFICANFCRFFFTLTNYFYFYIPPMVLLKYKSRRLFFISTNLQVLRVMVVHLFLLKKLSVYKIRGLIFPKKIIYLKPGKKRF